VVGEGAQVVSAKDADQDQDGEEDPQPQPERQPIAATLAQLVEPVVLERNVQRHLEADNGENSSGDVGAVAINPMQKKDWPPASPTHRKRAKERQGRKKDQSEIPGQEHKPTRSGKFITLVTRHLRSLIQLNKRSLT
jgi:hypothetical protein